MSARALGRLAAALSGVLLAPLLPSAAVPSVARVAASGCDLSTDHKVEVCLTNPPGHGGIDPTVINRLRQLFDSAGPGDSIRISIFRWDLAAIADDLVAAQNRGAHVEIVADHDVTTTKVGDDLLRRIESDDPDDNVVVVCDGACAPWTAPGPPSAFGNVSHNKLFLFDIGGEKSVATTSANLVSVQLHQFNNMLRIVDDHLYGFALDYFKRLKARSWTVGGDTWTESDKTSADLPRGIVYPRKKDPMQALFSRIDCAPGMRRVDIVVAVIQRDAVRRQIASLPSRGCQVRVIVQRTQMENWVQAPITLPTGRVLDLPDDRVKTALIHDKVIVIHAKVAGRERYVVASGAANFTCGALYFNDENMLEVFDQWTFDRYVTHVDMVWKHAHQSRHPGSIPTMRACP